MIPDLEVGDPVAIGVALQQAASEAELPIYAGKRHRTDDAEALVRAALQCCQKRNRDPLRVPDFGIPMHIVASSCASRRLLSWRLRRSAPFEAIADAKLNGILSIGSGPCP